jgi:hypothetical protein
VNGPITFVRVHEPDAVEQIIAAAIEIANDSTPDGESWKSVFEKAVDLLAARTMIAPQAAGIPFELHGLKTW